jgi:hypothetical protein
MTLIIVLKIMTNEKPIKGSKRKIILEVAHSSCNYWLFINGDRRMPIKAFSDANRHVIMNIQKIENGEMGFTIKDNFVIYSPHHILTFRPGGQREECIPSYSPMVL